MRKTMALLLAAACMLGLCACGGSSIVPYAEQTSAAATAAPSAAGALDYDAAWAAHDPEEVVFTVDGEDVTWRELFYEICYCARYVEKKEGVTITDWNAESTLFTDSDGNAYTYGRVVLDNAVSLLIQYHVMEKKLSDLGVTMSEKSQEYVETAEQNAIDNSFGGDKDQFLAYLDELHCTEELWRWFNQIDAMYQYDGFAALYGENGEKLSDADTLRYADTYKYVQILQIYLYKADAGAADTSETSAETQTTPTAAAAAAPTVVPTVAPTTAPTAEEAAADNTDKAAAIVDKLTQTADNDEKLSVFQTLYKLYNENDDLDQFPDGWCLFDGDTEDAVYQAALTLDDYAVTTVETDNAVVVVMALPIEPDAAVQVDADTGTVYTLRYYAAWQAYSDQINGDGGWIASADVVWADGFDTFSLNDVF